MNLTNLIFWSLSIITAIASIQSIDVIQRGVWRAQAKIIYESRTATWGSAKLLRNQATDPNR